MFSFYGVISHITSNVDFFLVRLLIKYYYNYLLLLIKSLIFIKSQPVCRLGVADLTVNYVSSRHVHCYTISKKFCFFKKRNSVHLALAIRHVVGIVALCL
jgi:hypothetical protein